MAAEALALWRPHRFLSSRHDGSRPQRAGVGPIRPEALAAKRRREKRQTQTRSQSNADYCLSHVLALSVRLIPHMSSPSRPPRLDAVAARVIRAARQEANLSQEALAGRAGLHRTYISLLERGLRSPTLTTLDAISKALGVDAAKLLTRISKALASGDAADNALAGAKEGSLEEQKDATRRRFRR